MKIAVTGPRPHKLNANELAWIERHMLNIIPALNPALLISGGALGVDTLWIEAGLKLNLPVNVILPFPGYDEFWAEQDKKHLEQLMHKCGCVDYVSSMFYDGVYQLRNRKLVDSCDLLVAYWNGSKGGTGNCVKYAKKMKKETLVYDKFD